MLDICLLGTGGMMPLPYRWLTSMMARCDGSSLLIDCGEGTQVALKEKGWSPKPIDVICFTHYHADHISGLPGLLLTMGNAERTEPLTLIGPKGLERVVGALRTIAPELPFQLKFIELTEAREQHKIGPYAVSYTHLDVYKRQGKNNLVYKHDHGKSDQAENNAGRGSDQSRHCLGHKMLIVLYSGNQRESDADHA